MINLRPLTPFSQSGQVRYLVWILVHRVGPALLPILPYEPPAVFAPLLPCPLLRHSPLMRCIRSRHLNTPTTRTAADRRFLGRSCDLELRVYEPACVW